MAKEKEVSLTGKTNENKVQQEVPVDAPDSKIVDLIIAKGDEEIIPWEPVTLPSRGLYYGDSISDGKVEVRAMGLFAEKILATQRLAQTGRALDFVFQKCVRFPNTFDPLDLLAGDRIFLLYYIRGITYGNEYEFSITCPNTMCGGTSIHTYDLNELAKTQTVGDPDLGEEPFTVKLPHLSKKMGRDIWVHVRFLRGRDVQRMLVNSRNVERVADNRARTRKKEGKEVQEDDTQITIDQTLEQNLNLVIVSVLGEKDPGKIRQVVNKLHSLDTTTIREFLREKSPGIDTMVEVTCPSCKQDFTVDLPITENFFRPSASRTNGERV